MLDTYIEVSTKKQLEHAFRVIPYEGKSMIVFIHPKTGNKTKFMFNGRCPEVTHKRVKHNFKKFRSIIKFVREETLESHWKFDRRLTKMACNVKRSKAYVWKK